MYPVEGLSISGLRLGDLDADSAGADFDPDAYPESEISGSAGFGSFFSRRNFFSFLFNFFFSAD